MIQMIKYIEVENENMLTSRLGTLLQSQDRGAKKQVLPSISSLPEKPPVIQPEQDDYYLATLGITDIIGEVNDGPFNNLAIMGSSPTCTLWWEDGLAVLWIGLLN